jgi:adenylosuccinate lyase
MFSEADAQQIKDIERTTNHDVKAVEYWLKQRMRGNADLEPWSEFVHFACTSEDMNNTSHALMLSTARAQVLLPALDRLTRTMTAMANELADVAMLSRTHGRPQADHARQRDRQRRGANGPCAGFDRAGAADGQMNGAVGLQRAHRGMARFRLGRLNVVEQQPAWRSIRTIRSARLDGELFDAVALTRC